MADSDSCSQCGQRKPVCGEPGCGESIIFVPKAGFGNTGEWRHLAPPRTDLDRQPKCRTTQGLIRPKVFVT